MTRRLETERQLDNLVSLADSDQSDGTIHVRVDYLRPIYLSLRNEIDRLGYELTQAQRGEG